jgi:hypothetical protein
MVVVDLAVLASAGGAVAAVPRLVRRPVPGDSPGRRAPWWARPGAALALVAALVYVNQVLFTVYVVRVHGGDPSFIARHLPAEWFDLAGGAWVESAARLVPFPELLAPSVLRVQAFLELPFVLLADAVVLRWLDRGLYRRVVGSAPLVWAASASYTLVFCVVEWDLRNPYTMDDIVIRVCAALVTPLLIIWMARRDGPADADGARSGTGLLLFAASTWALGQLVLTVYDTALLYNLGHLDERLPGAVAALAVLTTARLAARRLAAQSPAVRSPAARGLVTGEPGRAVATVGAALRWTLALFFVPALAVRYGVMFGTPWVALAGGLLACGAAAVLALRDGLGGCTARRVLAWMGQMAAALAAGGALGFAAVWLITDTYYEAGLLRGAAVSFAVVVAVAALTDHWLDGRPDPEM